MQFGLTNENISQNLICSTVIYENNHKSKGRKGIRMLDKFKNSKFYQKLKTQKNARAIYLTIVVLILAVAIVTVITTAANKAKKKQTPVEGTTGQVTTSTRETQKSPSTTCKTPTTTTPSGTTTPETEAANVVSTLPDFTLPVTGTLSKGHDATLQVFSSTMNDYRVHLGIDITTQEAAPVYAAAKGIICRIWTDPMMGNCIAIEHDGDSMTIYKNLAIDYPTGITEGATVNAGQLIAAVGNSAMIEIAEDPHLHFEMTIGGLMVDPLEYFDTAELTSLSVDSNYEN